MVLAGCSSTPDVESGALSLSTARFGHTAVNDGEKLYVLAEGSKSARLASLSFMVSMCSSDRTSTN